MLTRNTSIDHPTKNCLCVPKMLTPQPTKLVVTRRICNASTMAADGKRKTPRVPVEIRVEYERFNRFVSEYTRDISRGGMFIRSESPLEVGSEVYLTLSFPHHNDDITLLAKVVHVVLAQNSAEPGMGVRFNFMDSDESRALHRLVDGLIVRHLGEALYQRLTGTTEQGESAGGGFDTMELSVAKSSD
ncbi:MAG: TIGR02266 family protein [Myxococcota bacterium]|nr:TIGR02266 family protein [Myxococcota bacterium]